MRVRLEPGHDCGQKLAAARKIAGAEPVRQKAEVAYSHKPGRHDVHQESAQELGTFQRHDSAPIFMRVILPPEDDIMIVHRHQPGV